VKLQIRRFEPADAPGIGRLNERLRAAGAHVPVYADDAGAGPHASDPIRERLFVAVDGEEVRGAVWLREQAFWVGGQRLEAGWAKYPVAESLIDRRFSGVPAALLLRLLREQPRLLALGLGGHGTPFARLLAGMGWTGTTVPFQFQLVRPARALREIRYGGDGPGWRLLRRLLAYSGAGWAGYRVMTGARSRSGGRAASPCQVEVTPTFASWADDIWLRNHVKYGFVGVRDRALLERLYPTDFAGLTRLKVSRAGEPVGWACVLRVDLRSTAGHEHFGRLSVGLVADAFAPPEEARVVLEAGVRHLRDSDVDVIFSNQSHPAWVAGLRSLGFLEGPSNFAFYRSPAVNGLWNGAGGVGGHPFVNRGDCDGPRWS
jgi:hypothetical protein